MRLKVIDYIMSEGGGSRFTAQLLHAIQSTGEFSKITLVSHGSALERYRELFAKHEIVCDFEDIPHAPRSIVGHVAGHYPLREAVLADCDVAWFPWFHGHRLSLAGHPHVVASFHDGIMFTEEKFLKAYPSVAADEKETVRQWLRSPATMICSSEHWRNYLRSTFETRADQLHVAPLAGAHVPLPSAGRKDWPWSRSPFILCAANTSPHKNHELLLDGYVASGVEWPLVLCGPGSDFEAFPKRSFVMRFARRVAVWFHRRPRMRGDILRDHARKLGLLSSPRLVPLGYVSTEDYDALLSRAALDVMPTLGEGGGSFPAEEAVLAGIPLIVSDLPMIREQMARIGAEQVLWFDPRKPEALAAQLQAAVANYPALKAGALAQKDKVRSRKWPEVAQDYLRVFRSVTEQARRPA